MTRYLYGASGMSQVVSMSGVPTTNPATVYNLRAGGSTVTDIQNISGGALGGVVTPDAFGHTLFLGPDNYTDTLWLDFGAGPRWGVNPIATNAQFTAMRAAALASEKATPSGLTSKAALPYTSATIGADQMAALDGMVIPKYANSTARGAANPSPADGDQTFLQDAHTEQVYNSGAARWVNRPQLIQEWVAPNNTTNSVTFSSIPGTFRHLMVIYSGRMASAGAVFTPIRAQVNGDTGSNYRYEGQIRRIKSISGTTTYEVAEDATGGSTTATTAATYATLHAFNVNTTSPIVGYMPGPTTHASSKGGGSFLIPGYRETGHKFFDCESRWWAMGTTTTDGYGLTLATGGGWTGTAAVTSVTVLAGLSGLFSTGTVVSLYGLG